MQVQSLSVNKSVANKLHFGQQYPVGSVQDLFKVMDDMAKDQANQQLTQECVDYLKTPLGEINGQPVMVLHLLKMLDTRIKSKKIFRYVYKEQFISSLGGNQALLKTKLDGLVRLGLVSERRIPTNFRDIFTFLTSDTGLPEPKCEISTVGKKIIAMLDQQDKDIFIKPFHAPDAEG